MSYKNLYKKKQKSRCYRALTFLDQSYESSLEIN